MAHPRLQYLQITGEISVKQVARVRRDAYIYLLMGPTGAGKSSFIEALAGESHKLSISSNGLAGYTQSVTAYKLVNVQRKYAYYGQPIYLVDTPGFCDSKVSEIEVMGMVRHWLRKHGTVKKIIYFTPVTDTRLAGSRRRTLGMLREFLVSAEDYASVILTTTMWDTLPNEQTRNRAESNFSQLRHTICNGSNIYHSSERFLNTRTSALQVLDCYRAHIAAFSNPANSASAHLYRDLHERLERALQRKVIAESELAHHSTQTDENLKDVLERDHKDNNETLAKFVSQLVNFGEPPHEFQEAAQALRKTIAANTVPTNQQMKNIFRKWAAEVEIGRGSGSNSKLLEPVLVEEPISNNLVDHRPSRTRVLKGFLRRLIKFPKLHRPKWAQREK